MTLPGPFQTLTPTISFKLSCALLDPPGPSQTPFDPADPADPHEPFQSLKDPPSLLDLHA